MEIHEIRRRNLQAITDYHFEGVRSKLADRMGWHRQRASQLLSWNHTKGMGYVVARNIEKEFDLPRGWMDLTHQPLWSGESEFLGENGAYDLPYEPASQSIPLLAPESVQEWVLEGSATPLARYKIPLENMGESSYLLIEDSDLMLPVKPGDAYVVDPERKPSLKDTAVFLVEGTLVVGVYAKGLLKERITHPSTGESVDVSKQNCLGTVIANISGSFLETLKVT